MGRRATNNPRQIRSKSCGCSLCMEEYPPPKYPERKRRRDCIGSWQARYRDPAGRQTAKNFDKKGEAEDFLDEVRTRVRRRTYNDPKRGEITLEAWWALWWPAHEPQRITTRNRKLSSWTVHIQPKWGQYKLNALTYLDIQAWVSRDLKGYATQTKVLELLNMMLRDAVRDQRIPFNPADNVTKTASPPVKHPDDLRPPTTEQYELVRAALPVWYQPIADFAEETGLRWGEFTGLRRLYLDLEEDVIKVREVVIDDRGTLRRQGVPKTSAGFRTVPLTPKAKNAALTMIERLNPAETQTAVDSGMHPEELILRGPRAATTKMINGKKVTVDGVLSRNNFRRVWITAIQQAGIARMVKNPETGRKEWWPRVSDYRDRYASRLHEAGMSEVDVQYVLGHERGGKVTWLYTHRGEKAVQNAREALSNGRHLRAVS
ncbi:tyrosine-type recombinase/integrase [Streptomyces halobius]|uniref:Tyrosine-type recombinase/integrase n=1 Tax=Streptomyces halobius TaxID=2879846 RepID=A0ABY4MDE7_9ACTN|nr:tyrosine-type recombinase/integrase [Streptomyces halobius]UQA95738.1 tyrosine-type recombinase/integrase [Streptomyces halobius]